MVNFPGESTHVHLVDTLPLSDFAGQAIAALAGVDTVLVVINAQTGIELMTERMMRYARERKLWSDDRRQQDRRRESRPPGLVADIRERFAARPA